MLTELKIKNAKRKDKPYALDTAELGMTLQVPPTGSLWWKMKYTFAGKATSTSLGTYPKVGLADARQKRDEVHRLVALGINPSTHRQNQKVALKTLHENSFEAVGRRWLSMSQKKWNSEHYERVKRRLERDVFPYLGKHPISTITGKQVLDTVIRIADRGAIETAHRALGECSQIFTIGIAHQVCESNPTIGLVKALPPMPKTKHFAAITNPKDVGKLLSMIDGYQGTLIVRCALKLAPLTFTRPSELRKAKWADIDFDNAEWTFHVTKTDLEGHIVPLSTQAIAILREIHPLTGHLEYIFPNARTEGRPMSENAILAALRAMGIAQDEMSGHGFRAMARTIMHEQLDIPSDWIEKQLSHKEKGSYSGAYNRTVFRPQRHEMMQKWADYLDALKTGGNVIPLIRRSVA